MGTVGSSSLVVTHLCFDIPGRGYVFQSVLGAGVGLVLGDIHGAVVQKVGKHWVKHSQTGLFN